MNEETEEAIVEVYLKPILILPLPTSIFKVTTPLTVLTSRRDKMDGLIKRLKNMLSSYLYLKMNRKDILLKDLRLWKSMTNKVNEILEYDKKFKNAT